MKEENFTPSPYGDQDHGPRYLGAAWALVMLAFASTITRAVVRGRMTRNLGWDDYHMFIAQFVNLVGLGFVTAEVCDGLGRHMYYLTATQRRRFQIIGWLDWMQTFVCIMFCKISVALFLLRIKNTKANKRAMYTFIGCNVLLTSIICFLFLGMCRPLRAYWDVGVDGVCFSTHQVEGMVIAQGGKYNDGVWMHREHQNSILYGQRVTLANVHARLRRDYLWQPFKTSKKSSPPTCAIQHAHTSTRNQSHPRLTSLRHLLVFSLLSDLILATTPLFFLKDLKISRRTKILLCVLMGAGYMYYLLPLTNPSIQKAYIPQHRRLQHRPHRSLRRREREGPDVGHRS